MTQWKGITELVEGDVITLPDGRVGTIIDVNPYGVVEVRDGAGSLAGGSHSYRIENLVGMDSLDFADTVSGYESDQTKVLVLNPIEAGE